MIKTADMSANYGKSQKDSTHQTYNCDYITYMDNEMQATILGSAIIIGVLVGASSGACRGLIWELAICGAQDMAFTDERRRHVAVVYKLSKVL